MSKVTAPPTVPTFVRPTNPGHKPTAPSFADFASLSTLPLLQNVSTRTPPASPMDATSVPTETHSLPRVASCSAVTAETLRRMLVTMDSALTRVKLTPPARNGTTVASTNASVKTELPADINVTTGARCTTTCQRTAPW
ncbi:hypothetical protein DPMN_173138 [Dreissena polymorpha]|uniref:Uncharacterized protein n=1 Tax=Dreissena polymorpha TaxID=45954 RepID=A0A9D4E438_DREPO|nr:hypothetical protein DPMN_173138 [Dreissena polymorpha]